MIFDGSSRLQQEEEKAMRVNDVIIVDLSISDKPACQIGLMNRSKTAR
jgi:flagellar basal body L-ring protein FlgH